MGESRQEKQRQRLGVFAHTTVTVQARITKKQRRVLNHTPVVMITDVWVEKTWVATHLWIQMPRNRFNSGDIVEFRARVVPYTRAGDVPSYTLIGVLGMKLAEERWCENDQTEKQ